MDEERLRSHVGRVVSVNFDHGGRALGTLICEGDSLYLFGVEPVEPSASGWPADRRFRASAVSNVDVIS